MPSTTGKPFPPLSAFFFDNALPLIAFLKGLSGIGPKLYKDLELAYADVRSSYMEACLKPCAKEVLIDAVPSLVASSERCSLARLLDVLFALAKVSDFPSHFRSALMLPCSLSTPSSVPFSQASRAVEISTQRPSPSLSPCSSQQARVSTLLSSRHYHLSSPSRSRRFQNCRIGCTSLRNGFERRLGGRIMSSEIWYMRSEEVSRLVSSAKRVGTDV